MRANRANASRTDLVPAFIQLGKVIDVDPSKWTMRVRALEGEQTFNDCPIPSLYTHPFEGEGIHFVPEPGAYVWMCRPSEGDVRAFPLLYHPLPDSSSNQRANRPVLNPGDISLETRDRNGMRIRRGGVVEIFSTAIARTYYLPSKNRILTFAENWELETFGGHLRWNTARPEEDPDGLKSTKFDLSVKEFADHPEAAVQLRVGGGIDGPQIVDLRAWQDSTVAKDEPLRESISLTADRNGNLELCSYQPAPSDAEAELEKSVGITLNNAGEVKIQLMPGGQVAVFEDEANTQGVLLTKTFFEQLQKALVEIQIGVMLAGGATVETAKLLSEVLASLASHPKGGEPYISTRSRTE